MEHESIDAVASRAVAALRREVSARSLPELHLRTPRRWVAPVVGLAVITVVVVGLIAIGTNHNQSVGNDPAQLRWLLRDLPSGWRATTVFDSATATPHRPSPDPFVTNFYATDAEPLGPFLTVQGTTDTTQSVDIGSYSGDVLSYEEFQLDGKRAAFASLPNGGRGLYVEINSAWVYLSSDGLSDDVLRTLARTLAPDAAGHFDVARSALPDGMHKVVVPTDRPYVTIDYTPSGNALGILEFSIGRASPTLIGYGSTGYDFKPVSAGDFSGFIGSLTSEDAIPPTPVWQVLWRRDGFQFGLSGQGVSRDQILSAAASASQASPDEWAGLLRSQIVSAGDTVPAGTVAPAVPTDTQPSFVGEPRDVDISATVDDVSTNEERWTGVLPTGESWSAKITRVYDRMDVRYSIDGNLIESSFGESTAFAGDNVVTCCNPMAMTKNPKAVALRVLRSNGDRYTIPLHELPGTDGVRIALIAIPDGTLLAELVDATSNVLESYAPH
jgi:hypothetical protein